MANDINEIKKLLDEGKIRIGLNTTLKSLRKGIVKKVFVTSNISRIALDDISSICTISKVELVKLAIPNDEMGIICKKPFPISVLSVNNE